MPSTQEILHNRTFQLPSKPSVPVNMERVQNFLLSRKQSQKTHFDQSHSAHELTELSPNQEVLFRSPANGEYVPGTIINKGTKPCSYIVDTQGKHYHHTREHLRPINLDLPVGIAPNSNPPNPNPVPHSPVTSLNHPPT